eukprot:CAMPEP_0172298686 /NCGR_PEP_ID=MMETSP1058-20130122/1227_1 /TAXON_ID=83371 /ORGANISM="Detonula confervacea, Strain CCMP 353" /LENGTH=673 /DNA_ID=CAMNT_0013007973 /DNA_START=228 /DNA_END=2249 /DNA_ORIENTATION=-
MTGLDGSCHLSVITRPVMDVINGKGIVFAIQSDVADDDNVTITSFGFHVDRRSIGENGGAIKYEVYALKDEVYDLREKGYYASPRNPNNTIELIGDDQYDYRGESKLLEFWDLVAEGNIIESDLTQSSITIAKITEQDFFQIPLGSFKSVVPANGGIRSFYIAAPTGGFIYPTSDEAVVNDEMNLLLGERDPGEYAPRILVGEGVVKYPMPDGALWYQSKEFMGKVYYEKVCPSLAPSMSALPSFAPTIPLSDRPSSYPTLSLAPTNAPSVIASDMPSFVPSLPPSILTFKVSGGLLLSLPMYCEPGIEFPKKDRVHVAESTRAVASRSAKEKDPNVFNLKATVAAVFCVESKRRLDSNHRYLPTGSSALDFSIVITGEYRPPSRPGQRPEPPKDFDLGEIAEDSINRDPAVFVKDLKERAESAALFGEEPSPFADVESSDLKVSSFDVPNDIDPEEITAIKRFTLPPTLSPTLAPTVLKENNTDSILVICIVIIGGLIVLLGAFLLFRQGERRAAKTRREKMDRLEEQKLKAKQERRQKAQWEEANMHRHAGSRNDDAYKDSMMMKGPPQYGNSMGYGQQPPPPNYYAGGPPPHNYNYGYGGPPPPHYGQHYGGPNAQGYSYPPQPPMQGADYDKRSKGQSNAQGHSYPPLPPMQGVNYDKQPKGDSSVRWK